MSVFNIWDQAGNTTVINRTAATVLESMPRIAPQLAPLTPVQDDKIKLERFEVRAFGKGRFKAFDATPPIFTPRVKFSEEEIELVQLSEMTEVKESLLRKLKSADEDIRKRAGADLLTRARALAVRNEVLSDWMVMTAFLTGQLPIFFADEPGQGFTIDYQFPGTHLPSAGTPWTNLASSTPVDDIRTWQTLLADDVGDYGVNIWMNSTTWRLIERNANLKDYLTETDRPLFIPKMDDFKALLMEPERVNINITDSGYRDESAGYARGRAAHTKWIPDYKVLMTTDNPFEGERIADVPDGLVAVQTDWNQIDLKQGAQSEVQIDGKSKTHWWLQTATRMVRINRPDCIIAATVGS